MAEKSQKEMSFLDHLEELRWLLVRSTIAVLVLASLSFFISDFIFEKILFGPKDPNFITYRFFCSVSQFSITVPNVRNYFLKDNSALKYHSSALLMSKFKISCAALEILVPGPKIPKTPALNRKS